MIEWIDCGQLGTDTTARILGLHNGSLYAAGSPSGNIYRYDGGTIWTSIGQVGGSTTCTSLYSFGGYLWAGTSGTKMARWNGISWEDMGDLPASTAEAMLEYNGLLYICGMVVYRWDGGTTYTDIELPEGHHPEPLIIYNGEMYTIPTLTPAAKLYKYDGDSWTSAGVLIGTTWADAFVEFNGALYMGGGDTGLIYKWDGITLSQIDEIGEHVDGMTVWNGAIYACTWENASLYRSFDGLSFVKIGEFAAGMAAYEIVTFDGRVFVCLSNGHVHYYRTYRPLWQPAPIGITNMTTRPVLGA